MQTAAPGPLRVMLLRDRDDLGSAIAESLRTLGCLVTVQPRHRLRPERRFTADETDVVFVYGPHNGSVLEAAASVDFTGRRRPLFVWWLLENLPTTTAPRWVVRGAAAARLLGDRVLRVWSGEPIAATVRRSRRFLEIGQRARIWGEAHQLHRRGELDGFYVDSKVAVSILQRGGLPAVHLPFGGHDSFGRDLRLERDIDVVFLGQPGSRRRLHLLHRVVSDLARRRIPVQIIDGRSGYLDGQARTELLNRTKIVLNILKAPEDSAGLRFLLAAANMALTVSEPSPALSLLQAGAHYVEAKPDDLAAAVEQYLADHGERTRIAARAYEFVNGEGHVRNMLARTVRDCQARLSERERHSGAGTLECR